MLKAIENSNDVSSDRNYYNNDEQRIVNKNNVNIAIDRQCEKKGITKCKGAIIHSNNNNLFSLHVSSAVQCSRFTFTIHIVI